MSEKGTISDYKRLALARRFARQHHLGQKYGNDPYDRHLEAVESMLSEDSKCRLVDMRTTAWLHDVVEDTDATIEEVRKMFGDTIADAVAALTKRPDYNAENLDHDYEYFIGIRKNRLAHLVKIADAQANFNACVQSRDTKKLYKYYQTLNILLTNFS